MGFPESSGGFLACGGGATRTFISAGPARALEILLSGRDFTGTEAERYNLINHALPADQLDAYVDDLVARVSKVLPEVVAAHREVFKNFTDPQANNFFAALNSENVGFTAAIEAGRVQAAAAGQLKVGQTREVELDLPASLQKLND
jgi:enoyl-CoA hydratase/carnithine racemase